MKNVPLIVAYEAESKFWCQKWVFHVWKPRVWYITHKFWSNIGISITIDGFQWRPFWISRTTLIPGDFFWLRDFLESLRSYVSPYHNSIFCHNVNYRGIFVLRYTITLVNKHKCGFHAEYHILNNQSWVYWQWWQCKLVLCWIRPRCTHWKVEYTPPLT